MTAAGAEQENPLEEIICFVLLPLQRLVNGGDRSA